MVRLLTLVTFLTLVASTHSASARPPKGKYFDHAIFVIFENTNYAEASRQPFFKSLAAQGASFSNMDAITHPSQGNYIALTSGAQHGVVDGSNYDLDVKNIADLLEAKGLTWKVYAEDYPGNCFLDSKIGLYVRRHNPFISYLDIQKSPARCANIVEAAQMDRDARSGQLPNYIFYLPDLNNDGHDTNVTFADKWHSKKFGPLLADEKFMANTILITTFDESEGSAPRNQVYTSIVGPNVQKTVVSKPTTIISLLTMIEDNWGLGTLGDLDKSAPAIPVTIWKKPL